MDNSDTTVSKTPPKEQQQKLKNKNKNKNLSNLSAPQEHILERVYLTHLQSQH